MPRRARITFPNIAHHIIQRGNNRQACFYEAKDYQLYLDWLHEYSRECECKIHAYVLMTNHVHLLLTPATVNGVGCLMKRLGQRYVQYINRTYRRSGTLWEGRFRSCLAHGENYILACYRYIELNPVRANMVEHPDEYLWSSYPFNGQGQLNELLSPHQLYTSLGSTLDKRILAYRRLFQGQLAPELIDEIRKSTNGNFVLGNKIFQQEIEVALNRRVSRGKPGRPKRVMGN